MSHVVMVPTKRGEVFQVVVSAGADWSDMVDFDEPLFAAANALSTSMGALPSVSVQHFVFTTSTESFTQVDFDHCWPSGGITFGGGRRLTFNCAYFWNSFLGDLLVFFSSYCTRRLLNRIFVKESELGSCHDEAFMRGLRPGLRDHVLQPSELGEFVLIKIDAQLDHLSIKLLSRRIDSGLSLATSRSTSSLVCVCANRIRSSALPTEIAETIRLARDMLICFSSTALFNSGTCLDFRCTEMTA